MTNKYIQRLAGYNLPASVLNLPMNQGVPVQGRSENSEDSLEYFLTSSIDSTDPVDTVIKRNLKRR